MDISKLLEAKSRELKDLQDKRLLDLEDEIRSRDLQLTTLREQYNELKDSFEYNLELLTERDRELGSYDTIITKMNEKINAGMAEVSDLKVDLSSAKQRSLEDAAKKEEVQLAFQSKIQEIESNLEREFSLKEEKLSVELTETSRMKQKLELQLSDLQEDIERRRREWERNFEDEINSLVREHSAKIASYDTKVLQCESKLKQVTSEREALRLTVSELGNTVTEQEKYINKMEEAVENAEWDVQSYVTTQQARISELEANVASLNDMMAERDQIAAKKVSVCEAHLVEKEEIIRGMRERHEGERREKEDENKRLIAELEELKMTYKCDVARLEDRLCDATDQIAQLQTRLKEQQVSLEMELEKTARHAVAVKMNEQEFGDKVKETRIELEMKKQDISRYKTDLALAVKREESLRSEHEQELRLMKIRCEKAERSAYNAQEDLVKDLTAARDVALADLKRVKTDVLLQEDEIKVLRNQLENRNDNQEEGDGEPEIVLLRQQNDRLKSVIKQMTAEMETLAAAQNVSRMNESQSTSQTDSLMQKVSRFPDAQNMAEENMLDNRMTEENTALREEVMYLRKMIVAQKNNELAAAHEIEELDECKSRMLQLEKERDRLLELSNNLRSQLNQLRDQREDERSIPLKEITSRLNTARSILTTAPNRKNSVSTQSQVSLLHMSGDTSLNEQLSDICRMVETEENRPLSAASHSVEVTGKKVVKVPRPELATIPPPNTAFRGPIKRGGRSGTAVRKPKLRNYNDKK